MEEEYVLITRNWKINCVYITFRPQHLVFTKNIAKNPPMGDEKYTEKVAISTIDFGPVN